jgi:hypothetical protein
MTSPEKVLELLQTHAQSFSTAVASNEGDWIIKGFIDIYKRIYTISIDTKVISKVLELLLFPMFVSFAKEHGLELELSPQQNFYPDLTLTDPKTGNKFAIDIKSTYRIDNENINGMTLGAFTGYFRTRTSRKNTLYPYGAYSKHLVLGVIYSQSGEAADERAQYEIGDLEKIPSVIKNFRFFVQPKFRIASDRPGSGNTKNIGSVTKVDKIINGDGPFSKLGEAVYDDYWMYYLTKDMAKACDTERPYTNLKSYLEYKQRGIDKLLQYGGDIATLEDNNDNSDGGPK